VLQSAAALIKVYPVQPFGFSICKSIFKIF